VAGTAVKVTRLSFSTQGVVLVHLPDIQGVVVLVRRVIFMVRSFSAVTGIGIRLYHDIDVSKTLAFGEIPGSLWFAGGQAASGGGPPHMDVAYEPPIEMVGAQRCDFISSAGTVVGDLVIHYTTRSERNRTLWNELRSRTSYERD